MIYTINIPLVVSNKRERDFKDLLCDFEILLNKRETQSCVNF